MGHIKQLLQRYLEKGSLLVKELSLRESVNINRHTSVFLVGIIVITLLLYIFFIRPPSAFPTDTLVEIPEGTTLSEVAGLLKREQVVRSGLALQAAVFVLGYEREIQFGDYLFDEPRDVFSVARAIGIGAHGLEPNRVRVSEGATVSEIAERFASYLERFDKERFIASANSLEGYLFPDTYFFLPNADDDLVLRTLRQSFDTHIESVRPTIETFGKPLEEVIIMASILEREAHNSEDRRMIAGVLWERLERDMLLQVDATFVYRIGKGTFELTKADLADDDPYNTYVHKGLPPGPIGNPSLDSIIAAVTPIHKDYLFYLADENGITHYCETYACHLVNKQKYF